MMHYSGKISPLLQKKTFSAQLTVMPFKNACKIYSQVEKILPTVGFLLQYILAFIDNKL